MDILNSGQAQKFLIGAKMSWFKQTMGQLSLEFPVRNKNISDLAIQLETSGKELVDRIVTAQVDSDENQAKMRHIIGIERWGQNRLRGFLGDTPPDDEHDAYCPEDGLDLLEQIELFKEARSKTVFLAIQTETVFVNAAKAKAGLIGGADDDGEAENTITAAAEDDNTDAENNVKQNNVKQNNVLQNEVVYTVAHNEYGPLTPRGWLRYLEMHARMESKAIK